MNLHTPGQKPDWEQGSEGSLNVWQRAAFATNGLATPGNLLSVSGLAFVLWGGAALSRGSWVLGLMLVLLGRLADLADGYVAEKTHTKSRVGEMVDTTCDKVSVFSLMLVGLFANFIPLPILIFIAVYNIYLALFGLIWGRHYHLHANRLGKYAMFESWVVIVLAILYTNVTNEVTFILCVFVSALYVVTAIVAIYAYAQDLKRASVKRLRKAAWTKDITEMVQIYNPKASNFLRADKLLKLLARELDETPKLFDITTEAGQFEQYLKSLPSDQRVLITVAGGDGTLSSVVNTIIDHLPTQTTSKLYLLPLWGGNANDFAYMLNGLYTTTSPEHLLSASVPVAIPLIKVELASPKKQRVTYACCYVSFGASAFAARQLDSQKQRIHKMFRWVPPLLVLYELFFVVRAFLLSPLSFAEVNNRETSFYEHTLVNGSRLAKVNRIPIRIDEPAFFHAFVERKDPSIIITLIRILLRKPDAVYTKKTDLTFVAKQAMDVQIDGEILKVPGNTKISASVTHAPSLSFVSTRVTPKA